MKRALGPALATAVVLVICGAGCGDDEGATLSSGQATEAVDRDARHGRLQARAGSRALKGGKPGLRTLHVGGAEALLHVPADYSPARPPPLVVLLHGAGSDARGGLAPLGGLADEAGLMVLSPKSRGRTWDVILGGFGPDVAALDALLRHVFERFAVDHTRVALGGFSDGASYALSLGLTNGDLFTHVIAFSPGFMSPGAKEGRPSIYVSHGVDDRVLPIESCSRRIVASLRRDRYDVDYTEFEDGHTVPREIARAAARWLTRDDVR